MWGLGDQDLWRRFVESQREISKRKKNIKRMDSRRKWKTPDFAETMLFRGGLPAKRTGKKKPSLGRKEKKECFLMGEHRKMEGRNSFKHNSTRAARKNGNGILKNILFTRECFWMG